MKDELEDLRASILARKLAQNARRAKAGKKPMWPSLVPQKPKKAPSRKSSLPPAPESGDEADTALSFEEWKGCGWSVKKGEKMDRWDITGIPQFLRHQVRRINPAWEKFRQRKK